MTSYGIAGQIYFFSNEIRELEPFKMDEADPKAIQSPPESSYPMVLSCCTVGWVGGVQRFVEVYDTFQGMLMKVSGCGEFFIAPNGETINKRNPQEELSSLDREIIVGPALVLALALRGTWSLHASAAMFRETTVAFLGESGQGKSTLAAYLSPTENPDWRLVADDILPVTISSNRVDAWPHFPQLKLSLQAQSGISLPEHLPLNALCVLTSAGKEENPELQLLSQNLAARELISHTAGTRLFTPELLGKHLEFCTQVAKHVPIFRLTYPHRRDILPLVRTLLENIS